jgi:hypothetical protein
MSDDEAIELPGPSAQPGRVRRFILFGALAVTVALWAGAQFQQLSLRRSVTPLMQQHVAENSGPGMDVASTITATRDALFFGPARAKIEIFVRSSAAADAGQVGGIEYNYALEDGQWRLTDSGSCTDEACALRGRKAFDKR